MALAFKIDPEVQPRSGHSQHLKVAHFAKVNRSSMPVVPLPKQAKVATVSVLPKQPRLPLWLKLLVGVQQGSTVVTSGLVAAALVVYSWTVYVDRSISRTGQQLEALQSTAQQMTTANETLKHNMAEQAVGPRSNFEPYQPNKAIFLKPAPGRESTETSGSAASQASSPVNAAQMPHPIGY